jgi:hypothetical protein
VKPDLFRQPLSVRWFAYSEFQDGNVQTAFPDLEICQKSLDVLPHRVQEVYFRHNTAAGQKELLRQCASKKIAGW